MSTAERIGAAEALPPGPGSYAFALRLTQPRTLTIGRLGEFEFPAGVWLYVGSARGPGGLRARVGRHWRGPSRPRWHVDYLRRAATPLGAAVCENRVSLECRWAALLTATPGWAPGPRGFGASDCRCHGHLFERRPTARPAPGDGLADELAAVLSYDLWLAPPATHS